MTHTNFLLWLAVLAGLIPLLPVYLQIGKHTPQNAWIRGVPPLLISVFLIGVLGITSGYTSQEQALILVGAMIGLGIATLIHNTLHLKKSLSANGGYLALILLPLLLFTVPPTLNRYQTLTGDATPQRREEKRRSPVVASSSSSTGSRFVVYRDRVAGYELRPGYKWWKDGTTTAGLPKIEAAGTWSDVGLVSSSVVFPENCPPDPQVLRVLMFNEELTYPEDSIQQIASSTRGDFRKLILKSRQIGTEGPLTNFHHVYIGENVAILITVYAPEGSGNLKGVSDQVDAMFTPGPSRAMVQPHDWDADLQRKQALRLNQVALDFYERQQFTTSLVWCEHALAQSKNPPPVLLSNALLILNEMNQHEEALVWIKRHAPDLQDLPPQQQSWYAWHLFRAGQKEEGLRQYELLFEGGYRDHTELADYISLLLEVDESPDRALKARKDYAAEAGSRTLLLETSRRFRNAGFPEVALSELAILEEQTTGNLLDPMLTLEKLYNLNDANLQEEALVLAETLEQGGHTDANLYYHRAQSLFGLKRYPEAKLALEQALTLSPGNTLVLDDLRMVAGMMGQGENSAVRTPIDAIPLPPDFPLTTKADDKEKAFVPGGEVIANFRLMQRTSDRTLRQTTYRTVHITDRNAANLYRTISLDFNPLSERIYVNKLLVRGPDGETITEADRETFYVMDEEDRTLATFDKTLQIPIPKLEAGSEIELVYSRDTAISEGEIPFEILYFAKMIPVQKSAIIWLGNTEDLQYKQFLLNKPLQLENGLAWVAKDVPAYRWEALQGQPHHFLHTLILGTKNTHWETEAKTYLTDKVASRLITSPGVQTLATELTKDLNTPEEKVEALSAYVQRHCQYQGIEFGVRGRLPNFPDEILARTFGDCKDHSVLLVQLLREAGFKAWPVLVSSDSKVYPEFASLDQFDHMIACVELDGEDVFIDATIKAGPLLAVPPVSSGSPIALVLDETNPRLSEIPRTTAMQNEVEVTTAFSTKENRLQVKEVCTLTGLAASHFRAPLHEVSPEDRIQWFHQHILSAHLQVQGLAVEVENLDTPELPLKLSLTYQRRLPGKGLPLPTSIWDEFYLRPAVIPDRRTPFRIRNPFRYLRSASWTEDVTLESPAAQGYEEIHAFQETKLVSGGSPESGQRLEIMIPRFEAGPEHYPKYLELREKALEMATLRVSSH